MKYYVDLVLKKEKKPIDIDKIISKINNLVFVDKERYLNDDEINEIINILNKGISSFDYYKTPNDRFILFSKTSFRMGRFNGYRNGDGVVNSIYSFTNKDGKHIVKEEKYKISKGSSGEAVDGDIVLIDIKGFEGKPKIIKVLDRNIEYVTGEVITIGNSYFLKPLDKKLQFLNISLPNTSIEGQRVQVYLKEKREDNYYIGEVCRVFNHKDDPLEDILWEAFKCGIDDKFSKASLEQASSMRQVVLDSDRIGREDLTSWEIFTIDGIDTKDIDDALSCQRLENGNYQIGVHIADVSNYVLPSSPLDRDAYKRGNSNYLGGRVIPMLPHELSNGICSLNPGVERLAVSCIMEIDSKGNVVNYRISPTVIKSCLKMNYDEVNNLLHNRKYDPVYEQYSTSLRNLNKIALVLKKKRLLSGSIEFDKPELKLVYGKNGGVIDTSFRKLDLAENLIEEFMIIANEVVDKHLSNNGYPCLHRVHDKPNEERLCDFFKLLEAVNLPFEKYDYLECCINPIAFQELSEFIKDIPNLSRMLSTNLIRCMSRAKYSPENIGHMGLAKDNYCHFTSPIRRYSDLIIHRILKDCCFDKVESTKKIHMWERVLPEIGIQTSKREKLSDECENQVLLMKCAEYMQKHIGEEFVGTIIGLSERGLHVELDNMIEGRVRIKDMKGKYYYSKDNYTLLSLDGFPNYYIGDRLVVKVVDASKENKSIDFDVVEKIKENKIVYTR